MRTGKTAGERVNVVETATLTCFGLEAEKVKFDDMIMVGDEVVALI